MVRKLAKVNEILGCTYVKIHLSALPVESKRKEMAESEAERHPLVLGSTMALVLATLISLSASR